VKLTKTLKLRSVETRVGCYLLSLLEGTDLRTPVRLPLEKQRIAWQLGMSRETFSRALAAMTRYRLRIEGDTIEVIDPEALRAHVRLDPLFDSPEPILPLPPGGG
jgi:CRP/FNR family transcriptional regulator, transcriptional activator FtrB